jgi:predicted pyridoxine 5'-phosphate oxidase superfamily flavin-nucleotide-binding protein
VEKLRSGGGSAAERRLQDELGSRERAERFYERQVLDHLNERMRAFARRQQLVFVATADRAGACDNSFRGGPPGFIQVLGPRLLAYPEYRGNGVMASLANIAENPHIGLIMIDFLDDVIGLHVNGRAAIAEDADLRRRHPGVTVDPSLGRRPERWVTVEVDEAYIHCPKHIPQFARLPRARFWRPRQRVRRNGGDFFRVTTADRNRSTG